MNNKTSHLFTNQDELPKPFSNSAKDRFQLGQQFWPCYLPIFLGLLNFRSIQFAVYLYVSPWTAKRLSSLKRNEFSPFPFPAIDFDVPSKSLVRTLLHAIVPFLSPASSPSQTRSANVKVSQPLLLTPL